MSARLLADGAPFSGHVSLMHGWLPAIVQALAAAALVAAAVRRSPRWRFLWLPIATLVGAALAAWAHWYVDSAGLAGDPAPAALWIWIGLTGLAAAVAVLGWPGTDWRRRTTTVLAVPLCLLCSALALNLWVGYVPTVESGWSQLTAGPLPDQTDMAVVTAMRQRRAQPATGTVVPVTISDAASKFKHRGELVYLPPSWYATDRPPALPVVMMIGGEFNTPADWLRAGNAVTTIDEFAATHHGNAPVFVFVDSGGAFNNDTECVNGTRGNAADHLTKDVAPFLIRTFGVSADPASWAAVGWSMGGTCAVDLAVMHPDMFRTFVDIAGDLAPNAGTRDQTIRRLFGGDASAYDSYDPAVVISKHGRYDDVSGWFAIHSTPSQRRTASPVDEEPIGLGGRDPVGNPGDQTEAAYTLCGLGRAHGIACSVVSGAGKHDWPFAGRAFATALPWLAGRLRTPDVSKIGLPAM